MTTVGMMIGIPRMRGDAAAVASKRSVIPPDDVYLLLRGPCDDRL